VASDGGFNPPLIPHQILLHAGDFKRCPNVVIAVGILLAYLIPLALDGSAAQSSETLFQAPGDSRHLLHIAYHLKV
jgi:hypothetical protein